jgi:hypothetical protein
MICLNLSHLHLISEERGYDKEKYREMLWKRPNQYWDILVLIGQFTETGRKIGSGGVNFEKSEQVTLKLKEYKNFRGAWLLTSHISDYRSICI